MQESSRVNGSPRCSFCSFPLLIFEIHLGSLTATHAQVFVRDAAEDSGAPRELPFYTVSNMGVPCTSGVELAGASTSTTFSPGRVTIEVRGMLDVVPDAKLILDPFCGSGTLSCSLPQSPKQAGSNHKTTITTVLDSSYSFSAMVPRLACLLSQSTYINLQR